MNDPLLTLRPWTAPEVTSWGRLPMNAVDRRSGALPLDGDWRFQLLPTPDAPVGGSWSTIHVPGVWTMQGTDDLPQYLNVRMPFPEFPPHSPAAGFFIWVSRLLANRISLTLGAESSRRYSGCR